MFVETRAAHTVRAAFDTAVADRMAQGIVDLLEPVEIEVKEGCGHARRLLTREMVLQTLEKSRAIVETRERIAARKLELADISGYVQQRNDRLASSVRSRSGIERSPVLQRDP